MEDNPFRPGAGVAERVACHHSKKSSAGVGGGKARVHQGNKSHQIFRENEQMLHGFGLLVTQAAERIMWKPMPGQAGGRPATVL